MAEHLGADHPMQSKPFMASRLVKGLLAIAVVFLAIPAQAVAYDVAGHYYTHAAILDVYQESVDPYRLVESFCAELPDLAYELDAVVQRVRVSKDDQYQWGAIGRCTTKTCVHMVAVQFYLHALTGTPPKGIHDAAMAIIAELRRTIKELEKQSVVDKQELVNTYCMRGFAIHLLGDTHAHAMLEKGEVLYKLGLGHAKLKGDAHAPDYIFRRGKAHWVNWVKDLGSNLGVGDSQTAQIQNIEPAKPGEENKFGECLMQTKLAELAGNNWVLWYPRIEDWTFSACPTQQASKGIIGAIRDAWTPRLKTCNEVIKDGPDSSRETAMSLQAILDKLGTGLPIPQCNKVWEQYLALAYVQFNLQPGVKNFWGSEKNLNPESLSYWGCDPRKDTLADGGKRDE